VCVFKFKSTNDKARQAKSFVCDEYVYYLDCGGAISQVHVHVQMLQTVNTEHLHNFSHIKYTSINLFKRIKINNPTISLFVSLIW
jgi:hypothetical protein